MSGAVVYFVGCVAYGEHDTISCQKAADTTLGKNAVDGSTNLICSTTRLVVKRG